MRIAIALATEWKLNLTNLLPEKTVAEQEAEFGLLHQTAPDRCCGLRKVEPLFKAVGEYKVWLTGLRREQARSRTALEEVASFTLPGGRTGVEAQSVCRLDNTRCLAVCGSL